MFKTRKQTLLQDPFNQPTNIAVQMNKNARLILPQRWPSYLMFSFVYLVPSEMIYNVNY